MNVKISQALAGQALAQAFFASSEVPTYEWEPKTKEFTLRYAPSAQRCVKTTYLSNVKSFAPAVPCSG